MTKGIEIGTIAAPNGEASDIVRATAPGLILGRAVSPMVRRGDALVRIARDDVGRSDAVDTDGDKE
ncbi:MAG: hypothetical protein ACKVIN_17270 [Longimicrobiales bacterium]